MKNFVQPGVDITVPAPSDVSSGDFVVVGNLFGVAATSAKAGEQVVIATGGVWSLPKVSNQAWTVGAKIYATSGGIMTTVPDGNLYVGVAVEAAANPSGFGKVRLNSVSTFALPPDPGGITAAAAAGAANVAEVTITVTDVAGNALPGVHVLDLWLSDDDENGEGLTATTATGNVEPKAGGGAVLATYTAKKALRVQTNKDGEFVLSITDTNKTKFVVVANIGGRTSVITQLDTADYGSA